MRRRRSSTLSSAAIGIAVWLWTTARSSRSAAGCSASSIPCRSIAVSRRTASWGVQTPLASTRSRARGPTAPRTASTWPTSPGTPTLSLNVAKPRSAHRSASAATAVGGPATRVALHRTGLAEPAPSDRHSGIPAALRGQVEEGDLERRGRGGRDRRRGRAEAPRRVASDPTSAGPADVSTSRRRLAAPAPPRSDMATASPSPSAPPSVRRRTSTISRRSSRPRAVT